MDGNCSGQWGSMTGEEGWHPQLSDGWCGEVWVNRGSGKEVPKAPKSTKGLTMEVLLYKSYGKPLNIVAQE